MSKDYLHKFRRKIDIGGCSQADAETMELRENFNEMVDEKLVPTVHTVKYVSREKVGIDLEGININVNLEDTSENDQKSNDEKFVHFKYDLDVKSGDQIYWHDTWWILYHEERKTILASKTFTCKRCNFNYNIEINNVRYNFPVLLTNLTLYSDGMADQTYMSNQDGSRRITISDNEHSEFVRIGTRIMVSKNTVYEVCHIDDFSRHGVKDCMLKQVFISSKDDRDNLVAWNEFNNDNIEEENMILGENVIRLGANEIYTFTTSVKDCRPEWIVEAEDNCVEIDTTYDNSQDCRKIRLKCKPDVKYLGTIVKITVIIDNGKSSTKEIRIGGMF
ncbi:MAG: hypothetical protein II309_04405 [Bacilli bacterium]|nr:hypothetical protein [Bacilli bacterium]